MKKYTILSLLCAAFCMTALVNIAEAQLFSRFNSCATCAPCEAQPVCCDPQEPAPNEAYCDAYKILICTTGFGKHCSMREQWEALKCEYVFDPCFAKAMDRAVRLPIKRNVDRVHCVMLTITNP